MSCGDDDSDPEAGPVPALEAGDCIKDITPFMASGALDGLEVVQCSAEHEAEVYGTAQIEHSTYPGRDAIQQQMISRCDAQYQQYPGASKSDIPQSSFIPDEEEWDRGLRTIVCFLESPEGLSGSVSS